ncbi:hypothetical protein Goarm_020584 [Gossypium armourianum]|uniref:Uncharacterized protein n=1 Tax=Gossypium armourianum TaxID=34283 RepID=A0A7J9IP23_9ROSI|nr:hypothetical protein [Gossypium armourianum]
MENEFAELTLNEEEDAVLQAEIELSTKTIYDIPKGFFSENLARQLGDFLGKFLEYDGSDLGKGNRNFMRIRVQLDVRENGVRGRSGCNGLGFVFVSAIQKSLAVNSVWLCEDGEGDSDRSINGNRISKCRLWGTRNNLGYGTAIDLAHSAMEHNLEEWVLIGEEGKKRPGGEIEDSITREEVNIIMRLRHTLKRYNPQMVFFMKKKINKVQMERVQRSCGFANGIDVDPNGSKAGLCLAWRGDATIMLQNFSKRHIDVIIKDPDDRKK